jgi:hypothetical protein
MDPILVAAPPRCGTSMIAGLLVQHGVQVGHHRGPHKDNPKGGFENEHIKQFIKDELAKNGYELNPIRHINQNETIYWFEDNPVFKDVIEQAIKDPDSPWLFKEFRILMTWLQWQRHFPNAVYVLNRRNLDDNLKSMLVHPAISKRGPWGDLRDWIRWAHKRQEEIAAECPHVWVDVDKIWQGDMDEARKVVEGCGIQFDEQIAKDWIDPTLWHNRDGA